MKSVYIKLNEINDVYALVNTLVSYDGEVDLESGRYKVDGKSLLGIFSLDLRKPVKLTFHDSEKAFRNMRYALPRTLEKIRQMGLKCKAIEF